MVKESHLRMILKKMSPPQKIALSFLFVILSGTFLLMLPASNTDGQGLSFIDSLFSSVSATCVTGLSVIDVSTKLSVFGQFVLMMLIQIGGLGLMTFMSAFILILRNRISLHEKIAMKEMLNKNSVFNMKEFLMDILKYTLFFEAIGAILIAVRMIPRYGMMRGTFNAVFLSVSAFCNAGFDPLGTISLQEYVHDPIMCFTIMALIILGGLGFAVWFDVRDKLKDLLTHKITWKKFRIRLSLHTKLVLFITFCLILIGTFFIVLFEYKNVDTIANFTFPEKIMTGMFESVALRTAGFSTIQYSMLHKETSLIMMALMFIGGCPGGTAGGIKTTTFAVLVIYIIGMLRGRDRTTLWKRTIPQRITIHAMGLFFLNFVVLFTGILLLCIVQEQSMLMISFEAVSALATVGSSLGLTGCLNVFGKLIIILMMYIGRIGISTLIISMMKGPDGDKNKIVYPEGNIIVG